ncbi:hypothetical protein KEM54_001907, partial [Ascosphaera aggregata]
MADTNSHGSRIAHLDIYDSLRKARHVAKEANPLRIRDHDSLQAAECGAIRTSSDTIRGGCDMEMSAGANTPVQHHVALPTIRVRLQSESYEAGQRDDAPDRIPTTGLVNVPPNGAAELSNPEDTQEPRGGNRSSTSEGSGAAMLHTELGNRGEGLNPSRSQEAPRSLKRYTIGGQLRFILLSSWINVLLIAAPAGIALNYAHVNSVAVFVVNFLAIIPLAAMLSNATEEIALRTGETMGGLLNATFGNAVELIVSLIALFKDEYVIVQTSLIGSMLSNLLLVMGMCFFFGGMSRMEQNFNVTVAQTASSMLSLAVGSLIIPTAFHEWSDAGDAGIVQISRGTSLLLLIVYGCYLFFQLKTHIDIYNAPSPKSEKLKWRKVSNGDVRRTVAQAGSTATGPGIQNGVRIVDSTESKEDASEEPQLKTWVAVLTLIISTVFVALCAEFMVGSISALTATGNINETFVGLILLPIVGNAAEHATAVTVAMKDKMDLAIGVAVGSSKDDMNLYFDGFQIAVLFVAMLLVNYLIQDGKSHWLEGVMLMVLYLIISVSAWFYPSKEKLAKR